MREEKAACTSALVIIVRTRFRGRQKGRRIGPGRRSNGVVESSVQDVFVIVIGAAEVPFDPGHVTVVIKSHRWPWSRWIEPRFQTLQSTALFSPCFPRPPPPCYPSPRRRQQLLRTASLFFSFVRSSSGNDVLSGRVSGESNGIQAVYKNAGQFSRIGCRC